MIQTPVSDRFWTKVNKTDTCWLWTAATTQRGYGMFKLPGGRASIPAHRFAYETLVGPIPAGFEIDHICRTRACVRPNHLQAVTVRINSLRSDNLGARESRKTHCIHGHPLTVVARPDRRRACLTCERQRSRDSRKARQRAAQ